MPCVSENGIITPAQASGPAVGTIRRKHRSQGGNGDCMSTDDLEFSKDLMERSRNDRVHAACGNWQE